MPEYKIKLKNKLVECSSLDECKQALEHYRDTSSGRHGVGLGASDFKVGDGDVTLDGKPHGYFSYNGRFWKGERPDLSKMFD